MTRQAITGQLVEDQFTAFDLDGYTPKSGLTAFTTNLWHNAVPSVVPVTVAEIGSSGEYKVSFTPDADGVWMVKVLVDYNKDVWGEDYESSAGDLGDIYEMVRRSLGLNHENIFIDETTYDANLQLLSARVRLWDSKANCDAATDGGTETTGLLSTYTLTTTWEGVNQFQIFKQTKE